MRLFGVLFVFYLPRRPFYYGKSSVFIHPENWAGSVVWSMSVGWYWLKVKRWFQWIFIVDFSRALRKKQKTKITPSVFFSLSIFCKVYTKSYKSTRKSSRRIKSQASLFDVCFQGKKNNTVIFLSLFLNFPFNSLRTCKERERGFTSFVCFFMMQRGSMSA